jgi:capsular exopolysaccharide synthesis family protein
MDAIAEKTNAQHRADAEVSEDADDITLKRVLEIVRRRRQIFLSIVVVGTLLGALYGLQRPPLYRAEAAVMIEPQDQRILAAREVVERLPTDEATVLTQLQLIESREIIGQAMDRLGLFDDPAFAPDAGVPLAGIAAKAPVRWLVGWLPDDWLIGLGLARERGVLAAEEEEQERRTRAIERFKAQLATSQEGRSYVLSIAYTDEDPDRAARIANAVATTYLEYQLDQKMGATSGASTWLRERLETLRDEVIADEEDVERFRADEGLLGAKGFSLNEVQLERINGEMLQLATERADTEATLSLIRSLTSRGEDLDALAQVLDSALIANLRREQIMLYREKAELETSFGAQHPRMLDIDAQQRDLAFRIDSEVKRVVRTLENDLQVLAVREKTLKERLEQLKGENVRQDGASVRLRELERKAAATRGLYETLLNRYKETEEQKQILRSDATIISRAVPPDAPKFPQPAAFVVFALFGSAVAGIGIAFLVDTLDNRVRSARQIEALFHVPTMSVLPKLADVAAGGSIIAHLLKEPHGLYTEQVRTLFAGIRLADLDYPPQTIVVTSALPGEGKTTLSASLAAFAGTAGERAVLVDVDLRHPRLCSVFGLDPERGLVEVLAGECGVQEAIIGHGPTGLDILPAKRSVGNPTALMLSQRLKQVLEELRRSYTFIVLDTPPAIGFSDAALLATEADMVLLVSEWERTKRDAVRAALDAVKGSGVRLIGAALTKADMDRLAQYAYGYKDAASYYPEYRKYYRKEEPVA